MQDSSSDWNLESANMGAIYENSVFTISASGAENCHVGFLNLRSPPIHQAVPLRVELGKESQGILYISRRSNTFESNVLNGPLNERAWEMQERMLSPRILHFGREQIFWECRSKRYEEQIDKPDRDEPIIYPDSEFKLHRSNKPCGEVLNVLQWYGIVEEYTRRNLMFETDKLPALSGLARGAQKKLNSAYLAGLWRDKLHIGLSWSVLRGSSNSRLSTYGVPCWSWASIDGPISYDFADHFTPLVDGFMAFAVDIIQADPEIAGIDEFGEVKDGKIVLSGQIKLAKRETMLANDILEYPDWMSGSRTAIGYYVADEQKEVEGDILCLKLASVHLE